MARIAEWTIAAVAGALASYLVLINIGPRTLDDCILAYARGSNSGAVMGACRRKFPPPELLDFSAQAVVPN